MIRDKPTTGTQYPTLALQNDIQRPLITHSWTSGYIESERGHFEVRGGPEPMTCRARVLIAPQFPCAVLQATEPSSVGVCACGGVRACVGVRVCDTYTKG